MQSPLFDRRNIGHDTGTDQAQNAAEIWLLAKV